jgi:hypothetical protein
MTEVLHSEFPLDDKYVVLDADIKHRINAAVEDERGGVRLGFNKSQSEKVRDEPAVLSPRRLLQPVERLVEAADPVKLCGINKPH